MFGVFVMVKVSGFHPLLPFFVNEGSASCVCLQIGWVF